MFFLSQPNLPEAVKSLFISSLLDKPLCSNEKGYPVVRSQKNALEHNRIEFNHKNSVKIITFDIDRPTTLEEIVNILECPAPNLFIVNPGNGSVHLSYFLDEPVHKNPGSSPKPLRYLAAIEAALCEKLGADTGYAGLIMKNPLNPEWLTYSPRSESYSLHELHEYVDLKNQNHGKKEIKEYGFGRNCTLFDNLRKYAYANVQAFRDAKNYEPWENFILDQCHTLNANFSAPLADSEVKSISKSVAKWVWSRYTSQRDDESINRGRDALLGAHLDDLRDKQVLAATITNRQRKEATEMKIRHAIERLEASNTKVTQAAVAEKSGVSLATIERAWRKVKSKLSAPDAG